MRLYKLKDFWRVKWEEEWRITDLKMMRHKKKKRFRERNTKSKLLNAISSVVGSCLFASLHEDWESQQYLKISLIMVHCVTCFPLPNTCSLGPFHCYWRLALVVVEGGGDWLWRGLWMRLGITLEELGRETGWIYTINKWQPTPVFLPGESQGPGSLVGCRLWGRTESDMTEVT